MAVQSSRTTDLVPAALKEDLDKSLASAIFKSGVPLTIFDHPAWAAFFSALRPGYKLPTPAEIGSTLLDSEYDRVRQETLMQIRRNVAGVLGIGCATDVTSKNLSPVMLHTPLPWFIECMRPNLDDAGEVADQVSDAIRRLSDLVGGDKFDVIGFISQSCKRLRAVRRLLTERQVVLFEYGCGSQCFNNIAEDLLKEPRFKRTLAQCILVCKTINSKWAIGKLFDEICEETYGRTQPMLLYSASRWRSANRMFRRLLKCKSAILMLPTAVVHEHELDDKLHLPPDFDAIIHDREFWKHVADAHSILEQICKCLGVLENDKAPLSLTYACLVYLDASLSDELLRRGLSDDEAVRLRARLHYRFDQIYSPVLALAYFCDPIFVLMRENVASKYGGDAVCVGKGDIHAQCRSAIQLLANGEEKRAAGMLADYMHMAACPDEAINELKKYQPHLVWGQLPGIYHYLAPVMLKVFSAPATVAGIERNRVVPALFHTSKRSRCRVDERQLAIAHNSDLMAREGAVRSSTSFRIGGFESVIAHFASNEDPPGIAEHAADSVLDTDSDGSESDYDGHYEEPLGRFGEVNALEDIRDELLFPGHDTDTDE